MSTVRTIRRACALLALSIVTVQANADVGRTEPRVKDSLETVKRATIAIGWREPSRSSTNQESPLLIGCSGFLYQYTPLQFAKGKSEPDSDGRVYYWAPIWVVTAAHCIRGKTKLVARINSRSRTTILYEIPFDKWTVHPSEDVAVAGLASPSGKRGFTPTEEAQILDTDIETLRAESTANRVQLRRFGIFEYTPVAIVGFPIGRHQSGLRNFPLVRGGRIAQIQGYLDGDPNHRTFLVSGSVFAGNSGGPVVVPEGTRSLDGTAKLSGNVLLGLVSYGQVLDSPVPESLDLAGVVGIDAVHEVIHQRLASEEKTTPK